jgi:hypothetical protein
MRELSAGAQGAGCQVVSVETIIPIRI